MKVALLPMSAVTLSVTSDIATETPTPMPPTATPSALVEISGVAEAETSVPTSVAEVVIAAPAPISARIVEFSLAVAAAPSPATTPPATAVADADSAPPSDAETRTVELLTVASGRIFAVTEEDFDVVATEAPIAAIPPDPPPAVELCVEVSLAVTSTPAPPDPVTEPPSSAVTVLPTLPIATAASAPK